MFSWDIIFLVYSLHNSIVGVTVRHLSRKYILVSSICFPYFCPVSLCHIFVPFSSLQIVFYKHFVEYLYMLSIFCYNDLFTKYIVQLFLVFNGNYFTILLPHIPTLWVQLCFSIFRGISVFATSLFLCSKFIKSCSCTSLVIVYGNWKIHHIITT